MVGFSDQARPGIRWLLSGVSWVFLDISVPDGSLPWASEPNVFRSGLVWLESGDCRRTLRPPEAPW